MNLLTSRLNYPAGIVVVAIVLYFVASPTTLFGPSTSAAISLANGTYKNPCCAPIVLNDGELSTGTAQTSYVIDRAPENQGGDRWVRPEAKVMVKGGNAVEVREQEHPGSLVLDKTSTPPRFIEIGSDRSRQVRFVRAD